MFSSEKYRKDKVLANNAKCSIMLNVQLGNTFLTRFGLLSKAVLFMKWLVGLSLSCLHLNGLSAVSFSPTHT